MANKTKKQVLYSFRCRYSEDEYERSISKIIMCALQGTHNNAAERAIRAVAVGRKNSYDLCQILSPKRPTQLRELRYIAD